MPCRRRRLVARPPILLPILGLLATAPLAQAQVVDVPDLRRDPVDLQTGEHLDGAGRVPPRADDLSTRSYALLPTKTLWREIELSSRHAFIVVKSPAQERGFFKGKALIDRRAVLRIKNDMLATVSGLSEIPAEGRGPQLPRTPGGMEFPGFFATLDSVETLARLRDRRDLDYVEPMHPEMVLEDSLACGFDPYAPSLDPALLDEAVVFNGSPDIVPYSFRHLGITRAWKRLGHPGEGVRLALLDTGISTQQDQLQAGFIGGAVARPPIVHLDTTGTGLEDDCGHGTKVAGIAAAPRDGQSIAGALWAASLTTIKAGGSPQHTIPDSAAYEVCGGIALAVQSRAQVVMMAFGYPFHSPTVAECIRDAFDSTSAIFVAAAGTQVSWVTFPASMNREVIAASAVHVTGPASYAMFGTPGSVAYGPDVDFVSVMGMNRIPTTGRVGNAVTQEIAAGGGSSAAVPHIAAVFGLAIQATAGAVPSLTRAQIISRVRNASSIDSVRDANGQPLQPGHIGDGVPNAYAVAGGTTRVEVAGPATVQVNQPFTYAAAADGDAALSYTWTLRALGGAATAVRNTQTATFTATATGAFELSLKAVDPVDQETFEVSQRVTVTAGPVPPPALRHLVSVDTAAHGPTLLSGGRYDFVVNPGVSMPSGCAVVSRAGHLQCTDGGLVHDCAQTATTPFADYSTSGFAVSAPPGAAANSLETNIHLWHDGLNSLSVRVHYVVSQPAGVVCDVPGHTWAEQSCIDDNQCASLECAAGTCAPRRSLGDTCLANANCDSGYCDAGDGTSKTNRCMPSKDGRSGDVCSHDNQCASLTCSGLAKDARGAWVPGACAAKKADGESCTADGHCASGFCAAGTTGTVCTRRSALGASCSAHPQCLSGYCDAGDGTSKTNQCMPNGSGRDGELCSHDNQCRSLNCGGLRQDSSGAWVPGACAPKRSLGAACSTHFQCGSGYCDAGDGTSHTSLCMPNKVGQAGEICSHGNQCASGVCAGLARDGSGAWVPGACAGLTALGAACTANVQCVSAYCDAGDGTSKTGLCMPNGLGQNGDICSNDKQCVFLNCSGLRQAAGGAWVPGTCATRKALGTMCSANGQCDSGYCDAGNGTSRTALCMPNKNGQAGDVCSHSNQCLSLSCVGLRQNAAGAWVPGACAAQGAAGASCTAHAECSSGFCDPTPRTCANKSALGAACSANVQCLSSYCDAGDGTSKTNRCMPNGFGQNGDICSHDKQCGSLNCAGLREAGGAWIPGACAAKRTLGASCSAHAQCGSEYCDAGDGTSRTNRCMPNQNGRDGDICSHDNQCLSHTCAGLRASGGAWIPGACADKAPLGGSCSQHFHCTSGYCDSGNGTSRTDRCMPNRDGRGGDICSHDNQCLSNTCAGLTRNASGAWVPGVHDKGGARGHLYAALPVPLGLLRQRQRHLPDRPLHAQPQRPQRRHLLPSKPVLVGQLPRPARERQRLGARAVPVGCPASTPVSTPPGWR